MMILPLSPELAGRLALAWHVAASLLRRLPVVAALLYCSASGWLCAQPTAGDSAAAHCLRVMGVERMLHGDLAGAERLLVASADAIDVPPGDSVRTHRVRAPIVSCDTASVIRRQWSPADWRGNPLRGGTAQRLQLLATLGALGRCAVLQGRADRADSLFDIVLEIARRMRAAVPRGLFACLLADAARAEHDIGDNTAALVHAADAVSMLRMVCAGGCDTSVLRLPGTPINQPSGDALPATVYHDISPTAAHCLPDCVELASAVLDLGALYRERGAYGQAEPLLREAVARCLALGRNADSIVLLRALVELAGYAQDRGLVGESNVLRARAAHLTAVLNVPDSRALAGCYANAAGLIVGNTASTGRASADSIAARLLRQAVAMLERIVACTGGDAGNGILLDLARVTTSVARVESDVGNLAEADREIRKARGIYRRLCATRVHPDLVAFLITHGSISARLGNRRAANAMYGQALAVAHALYARRGALDEAEAIVQVARACEQFGLATRAGQAYLGLLGVLPRATHESIQFEGEERQIRLGQRLAPIARALALWLAARNDGGALFNLSLWAKGRVLASVAWRNRTMRSAATANPIVADVWRGYVDARREAAAWAAGEQRAVADLESESAVDADANADADLGAGAVRDVDGNSNWGSRIDAGSEATPTSREYSARKQADARAMQQAGGRALARAEQFDDSLARIGASQVGRRSKRTWRGVRGRLHAGDAVVEFMRLDTPDSVRYLALVLRPEFAVPFVVPIAGERHLADLLGYPVGAPETDNTSYIHDAARGAALYRAVWLPLEPLLRGARRVYISPDGLLNTIAFAALPADSGRYLADRHSLRYLFSSLDLLPPRRVVADLAATPPPSALVLGGADFAPRGHPAGSAGLRPLWGTLQEAEQVAGILGRHGYGVTLRTGALATEPALLQARSPTVLHIATHGFFTDEQALPMPSGAGEGALELAPGRGLLDPLTGSGLFLAGADGVASPAHPDSDGVVTAYDIAHMDLSNTRLAVLSACETARGRIVAGEGVLGLKRALRAAGAACVLIALWPVPDNAARRMIERFYSNWLDHGASLPDALNEARGWMQSEYGDPYYWAGFVLVGG